MDYHVILIEYGKPTHHWIYTYACEAVKQLERLNCAYEECNEIFATLVKAGRPEREDSIEDLLRNMIIPSV